MAYKVWLQKGVIMKILHTSDLHLGKKINGYDLLAEQKLKLEQLIKYIIENDIAAIILAGDIYDTSLATDEAIKLFNYFLKRLISIPNIHIFVIAGNHDSRIRLGNKSVYESLNDRVHFATTIEDVSSVSLGEVVVNLIPFLKLEDINSFYNEHYDSLEVAYKQVIKELKLKKDKINICVAHQAVNPSQGSYTASDSEVKQIGGEDILPSSIFQDFTYVALGHIHMPQKISNNTYYSGSIFKYHHNESKQERSFIVYDTDTNNITRIPYAILHDVVVKQGAFADFLKGDGTDYIFFKLTDSTRILNAADTLKAKYPNFLGLAYEFEDNNLASELNIEVEDKTYFELFAEFFKQVKGKELTIEQAKFVKKMFEEVGE